MSTLRRSARLAAVAAKAVAAKKPRYLEGAPTPAEERAYSDTLTPLFAQLEAKPANSPERVAHIVRIFEAVMTPAGSRVVAYHPKFRNELWAAIQRVCDQAYTLPSGGGLPIFRLTGRYALFLDDVQREDCYRHSY